MARALQLRALVAASLAFAAASIAIPYLTDRNDVVWILWVTFPCSVIWCALLVISIRRFRWRGLWLLVGAPLALWWPFMYAMIAFACARNGRACP